MSEVNGQHDGQRVGQDVFVFDDPEPDPFAFRYKNKDYVARSATTAASVKFRNALSRAARVRSVNGEFKIEGFEGLAESEVLLVQQCTFEVVNGRDGQVRYAPVSRGWVENLPPSVTHRLYTEIDKRSPMLRGVPDRRESGPETPGPGGNTGVEDAPADESEQPDAPAEDSLPKGWPETTTAPSS